MSDRVERPTATEDVFLFTKKHLAEHFVVGRAFEILLAPLIAVSNTTNW